VRRKAGLRRWYDWRGPGLRRMPLRVGLSDRLGTTLRTGGAEARLGHRALAPKAPPQPWQAWVPCKSRGRGPDPRRVKWRDARWKLERWDEAALCGLPHEPAGERARSKTAKPSLEFVLRGPWPRAAVVVHGASRCVPNVRGNLPAEAGAVSPD